MTDKPCKVCNFTRQKSYGLVAPSIDELKEKGAALMKGLVTLWSDLFDMWKYADSPDEQVVPEHCRLTERRICVGFAGFPPPQSKDMPVRLICYSKLDSRPHLSTTISWDIESDGRQCLGFNSSDSVTVVLENDGTVVEDQAYFLCLPSNTKFMLLNDKETWSPLCRIDGGTAWMARDSVMLETDAVDSSSTVAPWYELAQQLKQDLTSIILMSEADLQTLVDAPCPELASGLGFQEKKAQELQETLQRVLDRREQERQSKELLQLYLKTVEQENRQQEETSQPSQGGAGDVDVPDGMEVDSASGFMSRTLMVLKGKTSPETRLSTEDLQMVVARGVEAMEQVLGWDRARTSALLQACQAELTTRLQQFQAVQSIRSNTQVRSSQQFNEKRKRKEEEGEEKPARGGD